MRTRACLARAAVAVLACLSLAVADGLAATPSVSAGRDHSLVLKSDGTVSSWGNDAAGQLGLARTISTIHPQTVAGLPNIVAIAAGSRHSVALAADGTVWSWGNNGSGQLGDGSRTDRVTPVRAVGLTGVIAIAAGGSHTLALRSDGSVWGWGADGNGQLGDDRGDSRSLPAAIAGLANITAIAAGDSHSVALGADGQVWTWGANYYGAVGDGTTQDRHAPLSVLNFAASIAAGRAYTIALRRDGSVYAWGENHDGQLGDGTNEDRHLPTEVPGLTGVRAISASSYLSLSYVQSGGDHTLALKSDGTVWGWGSNSAAQLADRTTNIRNTPVQIAGVSGATAIAAGGLHSLALMSGGMIRAWGDNEYGQVGAATSDDYAIYEVLDVNDATAIAAGGWYSMALRRDGTVVAWGFNGYGNLSDTTPLRRSVPTRVPDVSNVVSASAGGQHTVVVTSDGAMWAWGNNLVGQLGDGTTHFSSRPSRVGIVPGRATIGPAVSAVAGNGFSLALKPDGTLYAWGFNLYGQLGDGTMETRLLPITVPGVSEVVSYAAGGWHAAVARRDGSVLAWGYNFSGQVGDGSQVERLSAVAVPIANVRQVAAGGSHTLALKGDGTVWSWGGNANGQLGDATTIDRAAPVQVAGLTDVIAIAAGTDHSLALMRDGSVWAWGANESGQLGDGTTSESHIPVRVADLSGITAIAASTVVGAHSLALQNDGLVWGWGLNSDGQLGDGTLALRARPVIVMRENGGGALATTDWFLDPKPGTAKTIPPAKIPAFLMVSSGDISSDRATVDATLKFKLADVGKPIYLFAYVRARGAAAAKDGSDSCTLQQASPSGNTVPPGASGLQPTGANVTNAASQAQTILNNAPTAGKEGNTYCTGAGATAQAAVANGRCAATIPGSPNPCIPPEAAAGSATSYQALWWNPAESGWGVNIAHQGDKLFATWFTYDADRSGMWLVMSNSSHNADGSYSGALARTTGPAFSATPWSSAGVAGTVVGSATFTFSDASHGTFAYTVNNVSQTKAIQRLDFSAPVPTCSVGGDAGASPNYSDLWWASPAGSENGWGLNIVHQGDILFATWYTYGAGNKGMWLSMSDGRKSSANTYSGTMQRSTGPAFNAVPWNASEVTRPTAGTATLTFADSNNGTFTYVLDGVSQSKAITRLVFSAPGTVCR